MFDFDNRTDLTLNETFFEPLYSDLCKDPIELILVNDSEIRTLNKNFREKDAPTDVLSFPYDEVYEEMPIGSIVISVETAQKAADSLGHTLDDELKLLFIHGLLHLLGYDHEIDEGEMREKEEEIVKRFELPKSLIVRNLD